MRTTKTLSITLPPEMLTRAERIARKEHRTMSELVREALRHYERRNWWEEMNTYGAKSAARTGVKTEEDGSRPFVSCKKKEAVNDQSAPPMIRVVLDSNVYILALLFGGTPRAVVELAQLREFELFASEPLIDEIE